MPENRDQYEADLGHRKALKWAFVLCGLVAVGWAMEFIPASEVPFIAAAIPVAILIHLGLMRYKD